MQLLNLAIALALGLIVGLERGWTTRDQHGGERAAGFRSFGLAGLTGGGVGVLSSPDRVIVIAAGVLAFGALPRAARSPRKRHSARSSWPSSSTRPRKRGSPPCSAVTRCCAGRAGH
ncbi:MAG TPA: hypothetical protein VMR74_10505 [Gammaproteobacteria bacterium]|nr:hypothetical protein [Gammaproteobacteria bacterium]